VPFLVRETQFIIDACACSRMYLLICFSHALPLTRECYENLIYGMG
jgi:hypothetical protein